MRRFLSKRFISRRFLLKEVSFDQCGNVKARQDKADLRNLFRGIHFSYVSHENLFYLCHNNIKDTKDKVKAYFNSLEAQNNKVFISKHRNEIC